jgi:hypothetical protein
VSASNDFVHAIGEDAGADLAEGQSQQSLRGAREPRLDPLHRSRRDQQRVNAVDEERGSGAEHLQRGQTGTVEEGRDGGRGRGGLRVGEGDAQAVPPIGKGRLARPRNVVLPINMASSHRRCTTFEPGPSSTSSSSKSHPLRDQAPARRWSSPPAHPWPEPPPPGATLSGGAPSAGPVRLRGDRACRRAPERGTARRWDASRRCCRDASRRCDRRSWRRRAGHG